MADIKFIEDPKRVVPDMLEGFTACQPHLALLDGFDQGIQVVTNTEHSKDQVAVISGGGSGHEPATAGFVGSGMLAATACGAVFASPSSKAVLAAIRAMTGAAGCLLVILNYTGDCLNFGLAEEIARGEGLQVEHVAVADDCGVPAAGIAGCRGIAGAIFVMKVAGAAAADGRPLAEVKAIAQAAAANTHSMGAALSTCSLPGAPAAAGEARIAAGQMELGLGIHGEPGAARCAVKGAKATVEALFERILAAGEGFVAGARVALLVNNLGCATAMEVHVVVKCALEHLADKGIEVERVITGTFVSSLNMAGLSLSLLRVDDAQLALLDAPTSAAAWPRVVAKPALSKPQLVVPTGTAEASAGAGTRGVRAEDPELVQKAIRAAAEAAVAAEPELTKLDTLVGDGDCGTTIQAGGQSILDALPAIDCGSPAAACTALGTAVERSMGGTSGALYQIFFAAAAASFRNVAEGAAGATAYTSALAAGSQAICKHGGAQPGDCCMVDALQPAAEAAVRAGMSGAPAAAVAQAAAQAAEEGAAKTASLVARAGRSSYVSAADQQSVADPGAVAVAKWLRAVADALA